MLDARVKRTQRCRGPDTRLSDALAPYSTSELVSLSLSLFLKDLDMFSSYAGSTKLSLFATPVEEPRTKSFSYVIAGGKSSSSTRRGAIADGSCGAGGTAGCVLASRVSSYVRGGVGRADEVRCSSRRIRVFRSSLSRRESRIRGS